MPRLYQNFTKKKQFKKDPMEFDVTEKKVLKKTCYVCGKLGRLKRNCPKKNNGGVGKMNQNDRRTRNNHKNRPRKFIMDNMQRQSMWDTPII